MIVYVEHDADGNLMSVMEVHTTEGADVGAPMPGLTPEEKASRQVQVNQAIAQREADTRAALAKAKSPHAGLIVLPEGSARPDINVHKVDIATKKVRTLTNSEKNARAAAVQAAQANANKP